MGLFDLLGVSSKKISRKDFNKALYQISALSPKEKAYAKEAFKEELKDGLSKFEIQKRCSQLMYKTGDLLESSEVEKVRDKLLEYFSS